MLSSAVPAMYQPPPQQRASQPDLTRLPSLPADAPQPTPPPDYPSLSRGTPKSVDLLTGPGKLRGFFHAVRQDVPEHAAGRRLHNAQAHPFGMSGPLPPPSSTTSNGDAGPGGGSGVPALPSIHQKYERMLGKKPGSPRAATRGNGTATGSSGDLTDDRAADTRKSTSSLSPSKRANSSGIPVPRSRTVPMRTASSTVHQAVHAAGAAASAKSPSARRSLPPGRSSRNGSVAGSTTSLIPGPNTAARRTAPPHPHHRGPPPPLPLQQQQPDPVSAAAYRAMGYVTSAPPWDAANAQMYAAAVAGQYPSSSPQSQMAMPPWTGYPPPPNQQILQHQQTSMLPLYPQPPPTGIPMAPSAAAKIQSARLRQQQMHQSRAASLASLAPAPNDGQQPFWQQQQPQPVQYAPWPPQQQQQQQQPQQWQNMAAAGQGQPYQHQQQPQYYPPQLQQPPPPAVAHLAPSRPPVSTSAAAAPSLKPAAAKKAPEPRPQPLKQKSAKTAAPPPSNSTSPAPKARETPAPAAAAPSKPAPPPQEPVEPAAAPTPTPKPPRKKPAATTAADEKPLPRPLAEIPANATIPPDLAAADPNPSLVPCGQCGRKFAADRLAKHEPICATAAAGKERRGTMDMAEMRRAAIVRENSPEKRH
ncbi:Zinc finger C2HC domain-containing protein 1A [Blastocladiella emersonii ATCC 22665]|nr:Zinc finger C2HC domain-containing protein 1A [Blastocladiella emersonii ATCC 22665]